MAVVPLEFLEAALGKEHLLEVMCSQNPGCGQQMLLSCSCI